jgi:cytoskeletal protein CcmA (bactofilin family)
MNVMNVNGMTIQVDNDQIIIKNYNNRPAAIHKDLSLGKDGVINGDLRGNINVTASGVKIVINGDMTGNINGADTVEVKGNITGNISSRVVNNL